MRIPVEVALHGGEPNCRNRNLHKMFRFVGVGEQAGTGIPRIFQGWHSQHWKPPKLYESTEPYNQTLLELRMIDLFPPAVIASLRARFGTGFDQLKDVERVALALAASEGTVNHARLCTVSSTHPVELTRTLQHLTQLGMLDSTGSGRGAVYCLPGQALPTPDDVFGPVFIPSDSSSVLEASSSVTAPQWDEHGCLLTDQLPLPVINDLSRLSSTLKKRLENLAVEPRQKKRLPRGDMEEVVLAVCEGHYLTLQALAELLCRKPVSLRNDYLSPMVRNRSLTLAFPTTPTHERQAYCATVSLPLAEAEGESKGRDK